MDPSAENSPPEPAAPPAKEPATPPVAEKDAAASVNSAPAARPGATWWLTRFVILRFLGLVYLTAFLVAAHQFVPLVGERGITPISPALERFEQMQGGPWQAYAKLPTIFFWNSSDAFLQGAAWTGVVLSALVLIGFANVPIMLALWVLYLSTSHAGGLWYSYGWDMQLPETGALAVLLCPWLDPRPFARRAPPVIVLWLFRWLIFRMMVGAFLIKWRGDECWRDFTALFYHYETQPVPNPLSRYLHFAPEWTQKLGVWWNHVVEAIVPAFIFLPSLPLQKRSKTWDIAIRVLLWAAAAAVVGLFFYCRGYYLASESRGAPEPPDLRLLYFITAVALVCCIVPATKLGELPWMATAFRFTRHTAGVLLLAFQVVLIVSGNLAFLNWLTIVPGLACLDDSFWRRVLPGFITRRAALAAEDEKARHARPVHRVAHWSHLVLVSAYAIFVIWISRPVVENLCSKRQAMNDALGPFPRFFLVNTYGAFGSIGRIRDELIVEGTDDFMPDEAAKWREYEFKVKPGDLKRRPAVFTPYHYRLDWQIWFAAMDIPGNREWMASFIWHLLQNDPATLGLIANNPFPEKPPRYIRVVRYRYKFAPPGNPDGAWWTRERRDDWLPPISLTNSGIRNFLHMQGWLPPEK